MSPPSRTSLPPPTLSHPGGCHRALALGSLRHRADSHWLCILHMVMYMSQCYSLKSSHPILPLLSPKVCPIRLSLLSCPMNTIVSIIFLDPILMCSYTIVVLLVLTYSITDSRCIHLMRTNSNAFLFIPE